MDATGVPLVRSIPTPPGSLLPLSQRRGRRWASWAIFGCLIVASACTSEPSTTAEPDPVAVAPSTVVTKTVREWTMPSKPYLEQMIAAFDEGERASRSLDLDVLRPAAQHLADAARGFRLSLESSGPVPAAAAVQGPAVIEATRDIERVSRTLASCIGPSDCTPAVAALSVAFASWSSAVADLSKVI